MLQHEEEEKTGSSYIEINLQHIRHNYNFIAKKLLPEKTKIVAMVKSNAYGHGLIEVSKALEQEKADFLGVFSAEEALILRKADIKSPILIFGVPQKKDFPHLAKEKITLVVSSIYELDTIKNWVVNTQCRLSIHIKIDTGMGRLGLFPDEALQAIQNSFQKDSKIDIEGICTHFSESSSANQSYTLFQGERFNHLLALLEKKSIPIPLVHAANSGAILHYPQFHYSAVRPGILLYGLSPDHTVIKELKPALSLYSYIGGIKTLPKDSYISYGRMYQTKKKTTIAIVPLGYADGIPLGLSNKGHVIIHDELCPILGAVCMNQFMVDITHLSGYSIGDPVIIIGSEKHKKITIDQWVSQTNSLPYDFLCKLSLFSSRTYLSQV